ncbi:FtsX-like permease family protein [Sulfurimonas sp.]|uniref:FtsX-like permease family protein n=1 Tax=Sulfurimonas sp. TaxID=2022749 RepID=UPI002AB00B64|nr:FtsX-like permease family protein [Sulfurimonas sp.]
MKSFKNHLSLVIALLSILFSMQIFIVVDRSIEAYKVNLANKYSVIIVSQKNLDAKTILSINNMISSSKKISADNVIKRLNTGMNEKNIKLLKLTLPKFYKLNLSQYPDPKQIQKLKKDLYKNKNITKVEDFSHSHDTTYKLLLLFKNVVFLFSVVVFIVTSLLIFKELRIWQFKHSERMSIMRLFGAPVWLRSAVLFRLAIVDAIIASVLSFGLFTYISSLSLVKEHFLNIGINVVVFDIVNDGALLFASAITLSVILASLIVLGHKEEV